MTSSLLQDRVRAAVDAAAGRYVGLAVGAFVHDQLTVYGTGRTGPGGGPPDADTLFEIGSVTKVITALALADAVARSEVALDTPLAAVLSGVPAAHDRPITLADLASHTAGLPVSPKGLLGQAWRHPRDPYVSFTAADLLAALPRTRLRREPGTTIRYSNLGAALLGEALTRRAGLPYERLVTERVLRPLGLHDTVVTVRAGQQGRQAVGHSRRGRPVPAWTLTGILAAGGLHSTVRDMLALLRAHADPEATPLPEALRLVQQPRAAEGPVQVGLGWFLLPLAGTRHRALWHGGATGGFRSVLGLAPDAHAGLVILGNSKRHVDGLGLDLLPRLTRLR